MKKGLLSLALLLMGAAVGVWMFMRPEPGKVVTPPAPVKNKPERPARPPEIEPVTSPAQLQAVTAPAGRVQPGSFKRIEAAPPPPIQVPGGYDAAKIQEPGIQEAEAVALTLRHFGQRFGGNPVGTNAEIVKTLNGGNPQGARYLPRENLRLNGQGELLDHYGTPYFFHALSATEMEVRSAGTDRTMWTADDIVAK